MVSTPIDLLPSRDGLQLHNGTRAADGGAEFTTDGTQWGYAVSFPVLIPPPPDAELHAVIVVDVEVLRGSIGVGVMDEALRQFVTSEVDAVATGRAVRITLEPKGQAAAHVMVRNTASGGTSSRFRFLAATLHFAAVDRRLLVPTESPAIEPEVHRAPGAAGTFDVLISHSSRTWNAGQCDRTYLLERYARPGRLDGVPAFASLPPNVAPYHGLLTVLRIELSPTGLSSRIVRHYVSPEKVVHAAVVGSEVVVCFDAGLAVFGRRDDVPFVDVVPEAAARVEDAWFGGLHTVVPVDGRTCLVSSAGADAVLWLDVPRRQVVRRWRLPAERYGVNYPLDETTWLRDHYIPNDLQLGHLNCAAPDGHGGAYFSVLGQGDVGRVAASGRCEVLVSGYVGCHGVRADGGQVYFSDSCGGRLMRVEGPNQTTVLFDAGSRWLHDAVRVADGLFLLTLGDRNRLVLADVERGTAVAEWDFGAVAGTVQFLSVVPASASTTSR